MFQITKLSEDSQKLISLLMTTNRSRSDATSLALGRLLALQLPMPSMAVEDSEAYFNETVRQQLEYEIADINELIVLNKDRVLDIAKRFFLFRYRTVFSPASVLLFCKETAVESFFGLTQSFDEVTFTTIREESMTIMDLTTKFIRFLDDLKTKKD